MELLEKYNLSLGKIAKVLGVVLLGVVVLSVGLSLVKNSLGGMRMGSTGYQSTGGWGEKSATMGMMDSPARGNFAAPLSTRNVMESYDYRDDGYTPGTDAEAFEVTAYSASVETRHLDRDCEAVLALKAKDYVIFESTNKSDNTCNYRFKVEHAKADEALTLIKSLDPRDLSQNIETIKRQIEDYTSREDILKKKLATIESTLDSAMLAYDEISQLARQTKNADSLASVIQSKIQMIDNLSQQKINVSGELDNLSRMKAEQLDRLKYTQFSVNIYENKYVDGEYIKDSWKQSIKSFVFDMNRVAQELSVGLVKLVVYIFQYLLYLLIVIITAKYAWRLIRGIWGK